MKPGRRIALAVCLAALAVAGALAVAAFQTRERPAEVAFHRAPEAPPNDAASPAPSSPAAIAAPAAATPAASPAPAAASPAAPSPAAPSPAAAEPPIEELLAAHGEEPGAVYYMSCVREALREGNPAFARELLRQLREQHPGSVLIEEAEALLGRGR